MPSVRKDEEKKASGKERKAPNSNSTHELPSQNETNSTAKKGHRGEGFSILNSLAKFMSHEKSESVQHLEPALDETATESESTAVTSAEPNFNEVSLQTSGQSMHNVHRSSTLNAISKAVDALQETRRRIEKIPKKKRDGENMADLRPEETQTSTLYIDNKIIRHDPQKLGKNRRLSEDSLENSSGEELSHVQVTFTRSPSVMNPNENNRALNKYEATNGDTTSANNVSEILSQGAPKTNPAAGREREHEHTPQPIKSTSKDRIPQHTKSSGDYHSQKLSRPKGDAPAPATKENMDQGESEYSLPSATVATTTIFSILSETEMQDNKSQTAEKWARNDKQPKSHHPHHHHHLDLSDSERRLVRKMLSGRDTCKKCDLFELVFMHGGEDVLKNKEIVKMFKKHMNSHLLKAQETSKLYKWLRKTAEMDDENGTKSTRRHSDLSMESLKDMSGRNKVDKPSPERQDSNTETKTKVDVNYSYSNDPKVTKRDMSRRSRDSSTRYEQLLENYLANKNGSCSEEVIIRRKHCHHSNDEHARNSRNDYDDEYYFHDGLGSGKSRPDKRYSHRTYEKERSRLSASRNRCYCKRLKWRPATNSINCSANCNWCYENSGEYGNQCCYYECVLDSTECRCQDDTGLESRRRDDDLSDEIAQIKRIVEGMLATSKGHHHDDTSRESGSTASLHENYRENFVEDSRGKTNKEDYLEQFQDDENQPQSATKEKDRAEGNAVLANLANFMVRRKDDSKRQRQPESTDHEESAEGKHRERGTSILSDMAFLMVKKEDVNNQRGRQDSENATADRQIENQEMKNKPKSGQYALNEADNSFSPLPQANKSKSRNDNSQNGKLYKGCNLNDPNFQGLVREILSVFCQEFRGHGGNIKTNLENICTCTGVGTDFASCCVASPDEIAHEVCNVLREREGTDDMIIASTQTSSENIASSFNCYREGRSSATFSYFYPLCDLSKKACNRVCCADPSSSAKQAQPCCCVNGEQKNGASNCCPIPLQESFKRYHSVCYRRVQMRQKTVQNSKRKREKGHEQRLKHLESRRRPSSNSSNDPRPWRFSLPRGLSEPPQFQKQKNTHCSCSNNIPLTITRDCDRGACEAFTYVVPQSRMYWQCIYEE